MKIIKFLASFVIMASSSSFAVSFDCSLAKAPPSSVICGSSALSQLDDKMFALYSKAKEESPNPDILKNEQVFWIGQMKSCGNNESCLINLYNNRIDQLNLLLNSQKNNTGSQANSSSNNSLLGKPINSAGSSETNTSNKETINNNQQSSQETNTQTLNENTPQVSPNAQEKINPIWRYLTSILLILACALEIRHYTKINDEKTPLIDGSRAIRNLEPALIYLVGPGILLFSMFIGGPESFIEFITSTIFVSILFLPFTKAFAAHQAGVVFNAQRNVIEIPASGAIADSIADYFKPSFILRFLRRVEINVDSIRAVSGWVDVTSTAKFEKNSNNINVTHSYRYRLIISSTQGEWTVTFINAQKKDAARSLIAEVAKLA